jgi:hypothetical protein
MANKKEIPICLNQLFRPDTSIPSWMRAHGMGDCTKCKRCKKNMKCSGYTPVALIKFEVKD